MVQKKKKWYNNKKKYIYIHATSYTNDYDNLKVELSIIGTIAQFIS